MIMHATQYFNRSVKVCLYCLFCLLPQSLNQSDSQQYRIFEFFIGFLNSKLKR